MAINVEQVVKSYGNKTVLDHVSFHVEKGEIFALLGTNGAGKTTLLECIEGLRSYEGTITVTGRLGVQLQSSSLPEKISGEEAVALFARWKGVAFDGNTGLWQDIRKVQYHQMSTGQKRRLHLALALLGEPDILILDEPTAGLDVESRVALHEEIRQFQKQGKTVLLASHDMAEVEALCQRVGMLKDGKFAFCGSLAQLQDQIGAQHRIALRMGGAFPMERLTASTYQGEREGYSQFNVEELGEGLFELLSIARAAECPVLDVRVQRTSLEEQFMQIAGEGKTCKH